jgi:hypothetical protein
MLSIEWDEDQDEPRKEHRLEKKRDQELEVIETVMEDVSGIDILRRLRVLNFCAQKVADEIAMLQAAQQSGGATGQAGARPAPRLVPGSRAPNRDGPE